MNQRGEYGAQGASIARRPLARVVGAAAPSGSRGPTRVPVNLGIIGVGLVVGLASWPGVKKKKTPLGFIAMGASGSMVAVGLTQLIFGRL